MVSNSDFSLTEIPRKTYVAVYICPLAYFWMFEQASVKKFNIRYEWEEKNQFKTELNNGFKY
jgi:hypothetical protein